MIMAILAEEIGTITKELLKIDDIAEVGLDSLLSLAVLGRVREELSIEFPADFFMESTSVPDIPSSLRKIFSVAGSPLKDLIVNHPPATSILLQGTSSCTQTILLFPDGSESSTSYAMLPNITSDLCFYVMKCPYMKNPKDLNRAQQDLTLPSVTEIRRREPNSPYNLAGWSAGGIAAFKRLILLDSPNPIGLEKLPPRFYHFLENAGAFGTQGDRKPPEWLIHSFSSFTDALDQ
ncbi:Type I Polyketide synthases (Type I PKS) [Penicillium malachiteum]|nr:Type I Polyketide synthases (Type I PKS) [Penicillium malachiteum]